MCSRRSIRSPSRSGSLGLTPVARSTASGNFAGWAVASATTGVAGERGKRCSRGANADRAMRIDDHAAFAIDARHLFGAGGLIDAGKRRNRRECV